MAEPKDKAKMEHPTLQDTPVPGRSHPVRWVLLTLLLVAGAWFLWPMVFGGSHRTGDLDAKDFNILLITMDTTREDFLGCYGNKTARTPVIDRLAAEGTMFRNCTTCTSLTAPSHSSIMTGLYPFVHGVRINGHDRLAAGSTTLAEALKDAGYSTGAEIASSVLDHKYGLNQGFDRYADIPAEPHATEYAERRGDRVCDAALQQLQSMAASRFFLWVHFYDPHHPYKPPGFAGGGMREGYAAEITFMDGQIGRLIKELDALGITRETLVVAVGDHGEGLMDHDETGHGYFVYDTTLRSPFLVRCPGTIPAGRGIDARVRTIDIYPTLLELVGVGPIAGVQGVSLVPLLSGREEDLGLAAYGESLFGHAQFDMSPLRCLSVEGWKYVLAPTPTLYELATDPQEQHNVIDEHTALADEMREQLRTLIADAPPPPTKDETTVTLTPADRKRLESLGYAGGAGSEGTDEVVSEMDIFEPRGADPREHAQLIKLSAAAATAMTEGNYPAAEELLRRLNSEFPDAPQPLTDLAWAVAKRGRTAEACELFQKAMTLAPTNDDIRRKFVGTLISAERWDEAIQELTKMVDSSPEDVGVPYYLGLALVGLERFDEAIQEFQRAIRMDPEADRPVGGVALALSRQGKFQEAEEYLRDALERFPDSATLWSYLANVVHEQGRIEEAIDLYRQAVRIDPDDEDVRRRFGRLLVALERWDEAFEQFNWIVEHSPYDVDALCHKAQAAAKLGRQFQALADYRRAHQIDADNLQAVRGMSLVLVEMRRFAEAEDLLYETTLTHSDAPLILGDLAYAKQQEGHTDEAYELYQKALELDPDETSVRAMLGGLLVQLQRWDEALAEFTKVIETAPDSLESLYNLGVIQGHLGRFDEARQYLERALEIAPEDVRVVHGLGVLYARQNELAKAEEYFQKALQIDPNHRKSQQDLQRVRRMMTPP